MEFHSGGNMIQSDSPIHPGITTIHQEPVVFHCNHYNRFLQLVIEDCHYIQRDPILVQSAAEVSFRQLRSAFSEHPDWTPKERLHHAETLYRFCGFGDLPLGQLPEVPQPTFTLMERHSH